MRLGIKSRSRLVRAIALTLLTLGFVIVTIPMVWMASSALKTKEAANTVPPQWIPKEQVKVNIDGRDAFVYDIPVEGEVRKLALVDKQGPAGTFVDPDNPAEQYQLPVASGERAKVVRLHWDNFTEAMTTVPFGRYLLNTLTVVLFGTIGTVASCTVVAYGFARFSARGLPVLFLLLLSTIMLPPQVTLIPTFIIFRQIGWYDTLLPLIVPAFFANAWDVFLLRQFFMTLPVELDDAARIDGCGPFGILWHVVIPQSWPALITVTIFTILYAWNDFYAPLIYLQSQDHWTVALGLQSFNALYGSQGNLLMAASVLMVLPPVLIFFFAQRLFVQGVVISGIKG
jgi:multiple sugar transport system permease protein